MRNIIPLLCVLLASCGGGGGGGGTITAPPPNPSGWVAGTFKAASTFAAQCAAPRTGTNPATGGAYPDRQGSVVTENNWLRSWSNDWYLWYSEIQDRDPSSVATTAAYFDFLKTNQLSPSGNPKDKFHFTYPTEQWRTLSQSGIEAGYGVHWFFDQTRPPRRLLVAYIEPTSPAATAQLGRGAEVLFIDGVDLVNANDQPSVDKLNAGVSPAAIGESHQFVVRDANGTQRTITMTSENVSNASVMNVQVLSTASGNVGYLQFNDHLGTAEKALVDAMTALQAANVNDLVLDMRYNGGGYLDIASEAAYMIAGPAPTAGKTFEQLVFNDKYPNTNPITGETLTPMPFISVTQGFGALTANQALPTLNLSRVFILTGADTCSASESVINGLRGAGVEVIQIGETTCGKPYGFYPQDNCGTTYFTIQFKGVNASGFGDYSDGFSPTSGAGGGAQLPGCTVLDDFGHELGDVNETRLATALAYRSNQTCTPAGLGLGKPSMGPALAAVHGHLLTSPARQIRLLRQ